MGLLAAYSFDEASGAALDASGNGRDVAIAGSLIRVAGHTNTALSQSTTAADSAGPALTGMQTPAYTIAGWVERTTNSVDGWLMEFKQSGSGDRGLLFTGGNIQSRCKNVAGSVFTVQTVQPTAGTPYHFACTNDGTTLRLFINGTEVGTGTAFSGGIRTNSTSSSFFDGCGVETWLDDARYYDSALDAATITTLMNSPVGAPTGGTTVDGRGLIYHLNRKAGTLNSSDLPTLEGDGAANVWAGTTGLPMLHALNVKAGRTLPSFLGLAGVLNQLAGTTGLEVDDAAARIP